MNKPMFFLTMMLFLYSRINAFNGIAEKTKIESQPLLFIENKGQVADMNGNIRSDILFTTHSKGVKLFFSTNRISYQFQKTEYPEGYNPTDSKGDAEIELEKKIKTSTYRMDMELLGANPNPTIIKNGKTDYVENFYLAHCPDGIQNVSSYTKIIYKDVYPNIDWVLYTKGQEMKYDFIVHPGGNPDFIQVKYKGAEDLNITDDGRLLVSTRLGEVVDQKPFSFQSKNKITSDYKLIDGVVSYKLGEYNKSMDLVIDPGIEWATYYGGTNIDKAYAVTSANNGNVFITGETNSINAIASGGFLNSYSGSFGTAFLVKFNSNGSRAWATYYGYDYTAGYGLTLDNSGNVFMVGHTNATVGIAFSGFKDTLTGNNYDAFLVKFNNSGVRIWGTYYGGIGYEKATCVAIDPNGNVFLGGVTDTLTYGVASTSGIASSGFQNIYSGKSDGFLVKFDALGNRLWGTYFGGAEDDNIKTLTIDGQANVIVAGSTSSLTNISSGGLQNTIGGGTSDAFIAKFNTNGNRLWGTYFGGAGTDLGNGIDVDQLNNIYLVGSTTSTTGIAYAGYSNSLQGSKDAFILKIDPNCYKKWATYYGGSLVDDAQAIDVDANNNPLIVGVTNSTLSVASGGFQNTFGGGSGDAFIVKFDSTCKRIGASYFGGTQTDIPLGVSVNSSGSVYFTGYTASMNNISLNGTQNVFGGGAWDAFLTKLNECAFIEINSTPTTTLSTPICSGQNVSITSNGFSSYSWSNGSVLSSISINPSQTATYTLTVTGSSGCTGTASNTINVFSDPVSNIYADNFLKSIDSINLGDIVQLKLVALFNSIPNIQWSPATFISSVNDSTPFVYPNTTTDYIATFTNSNGCTQKDTIRIFVRPTLNNGTIGLNTSVSTFSLFDTVYVKVELTNVNDIYALYMKLKGNAAINSYLNYVGYTTSSLLGTGNSVFSTAPTVLNGVYDFGITKVGASNGYTGSGLFYTLKFVTKNVVIPNGTNFCFYIDDISATNSSGNQVGLTNQGLYCTTFNEQVLVWPGDLNNSKTVTTADILPIGYFYNSAGPARSNASIQWIGQPATLWGYGQGSNNGSAYKVFADSNGDGIISNADQTAIGFNIGKNHALYTKKDHHERSGFDGALVLTMTPSAINSTQLPQINNIKVELKSVNGALNSFYGISFNILLDSTIFDPSTATFDYTGSIFGASPGSDFLKIEYVTPSLISIGMTRYANAAINGNGLLCNIRVKTQSSVPNNSSSTIVSTYVDEANDALGVLFDINDDSTYAVAISLNNGINELTDEQLEIYPNPVSKTLHIETKVSINEVLIFDALGNLVNTVGQPKSNNIDVSRLSSGVYIAEIKTDNGIAKRRWVKE